MINAYMQPQVTVIKHVNCQDNVVELKFLSLNSTSLNRSLTFSSKEPETLKWLEQYGGGILFNIGANVGIYSCYYALESGGE